jgi:hypothetical protein
MKILIKFYLILIILYNTKVEKLSIVKIPCYRTSINTNNVQKLQNFAPYTTTNIYFNSRPLNSNKLTLVSLTKYLKM